MVLCRALIPTSNSYIPTNLWSKWHTVLCSMTIWVCFQHSNAYNQLPLIAADIVNSERAFSKVFVQYPPLFQFRSVQFSPLADWVIRRDMKDDSAEILFQSFLQEAVVSLWCCPSIMSSTDQGITHPPRCPKGWFWRGCCGVWRVRTMRVPSLW